MNRILLLVAFAAGLVAAGRITMNPDRVQDRMSLEDLQRQKFILDIVQNIRQPLQQNDLIQLDQGLIVDSQRYRGGIDGEMQRVIDLDRQRRLLDEHQVYSVGRLEDVQQLRGIYRLLVRSLDFDTLRRNVVYLRRNINPVLLVNALALAIRDREDTRSLIVPAVQELLPELYLDEDVIEQVRGIQREQTQRPSLIDIVGLRQRGINPVLNILMPWREIHMQMALMRQQQKNRQNVVGQKRLVIRAENQGQIDGTSLLTDDIALRNFVQNLIQELAMQEDVNQERDQLINREQEQQWINGGDRDQSQWNIRERELGQDSDTGRLLRVNRRRLMEQNQDQDQGRNIYGSQRERFQRVLRRDDDNDNDDDDDNDDIRMGRVPLQRGISQGGLRIGGVRDLPTVNVNSDRLLHVSRRRLNAIQQEQDQLSGRQRLMGLMRGDRLSEGRRVGQLDEVRQNDWQMKRQRQNLDQDEEQEQQGQIQRQGRRLGVQQDRQSIADQLESVDRDDERLVHINRRRLNQDIQEQQQQQQQQKQRNMPRRIDSIGEGRRVLGDRPIQDEDILKLIRSEHRLQLMSDDEILEMLQRNRQQRLERKQNDDDDDDNDDDDDDNVQRRQGVRSRRSLPNLRQQNNNRRSEILLHTLRQLVARLNQESISQGQVIEQQQQQQQWINNPRLSQNERYALRMNQIRIDSQRNREVLGQIGQIEQRLQQVIGQVLNQVNVNSLLGQMEEQRQVESLIADVLLGRLGQVGILNIIRQVVEDNNVQQIDRTGLGIRLSDPVVQHTLRGIVRIVDQQRELILGAYRQEQLQMRGVSINDVRVDKLRTRIEENDLDLSNLVEQQQDQGVQQEIVGRQRRLNNKAFTIDMDITSDQDQDAIIRVFLGPAENQQGRQGVSLDERRRDFVLLDAINVQLQSGRNRVQQRSVDIPWTSNDVTPLGEIYRRVMLQLKGQQEQQVVGIQELVGENGRFPQHLLLPRGRPEGLPMQLLVVVSPLVEQQQRDIVPDISIGIGSASLRDVRPLGYPLDRPIRNEQELLQLSNVLLQDVVIIQDN
ncbi:fat-body protein 1 isoform X2 [Drosophila rhopaloa]|uniref:Fat-body protein 1 n=1 Tax=Drosophila rhopaloa TaxID=1041015 RepID=A0ABM5HZZ6_DRORH|nr:fat-body protein 1 isoform X2 [Drosophila rhopaloa]